MNSDKEIISSVNEDGSTGTQTTSTGITANDIVIVSNVNKEFQEEFLALADKYNMKVVQLGDEFVEDYVSTFNARINNYEEAYKVIRDHESRVVLSNRVIELYCLMTPITVENMEKVKFTRHQMARATKLKASEIETVLNTLHGLGMVRFTRGKHEFVFVSNPESICTAIDQDFENAISKLELHYNRLMAAINLNEGCLSKTARKTVAAGLRRRVRQALDRFQ